MKFKRYNRPNIKFKFELTDQQRYQTGINILNWFRQNYCGIISIAFMIIIYLFSSQTGESSLYVSNNVESLCSKIFGINYLVAIISIRKLAHFSLYALLGHCVFTHIRIKYCLKYRYLYYLSAFLITAVYACTDEFHQLFVYGRGASCIDVLIDISGCLLALIINLIVISILEKRDMKLNKIVSDMQNNRKEITQ